MKKFNDNLLSEKSIKVCIKNVNIEIFRGVNKNGKPVIQKLKPVETLKKRMNELNGIPFDEIKKAILTIQSEEKRLNSKQYFEEFDKKLIQLREKLNYKRENYKWYHFLIRFLPYNDEVNNRN